MARMLSTLHFGFSIFHSVALLKKDFESKARLNQNTLKFFLIEAQNPLEGFIGASCPKKRLAKPLLFAPSQNDRFPICLSCIPG